MRDYFENIENYLGDFEDNINRQLEEVTALLAMIEEDEDRAQLGLLLRNVTDIDNPEKIRMAMQQAKSMARDRSRGRGQNSNSNPKK